MSGRSPRTTERMVPGTTRVQFRSPPPTKLPQRVPSLQVSYFVEDAVGPGGGDARAVNAGRVSVDAIWPRLRRPLESEYYISGPPPMLRGIGQELRARNIAGEAIHIDAWA